MVVLIAASELKDGVPAFLERCEADPDWGWIELFTPGNYAAFRAELEEMANDPDLTVEAFEESIDAWRATANLDGSPEILAELRRSQMSKDHKPLSYYLKS